MKKKITVLLLGLVILFSSVPAFALESTGNTTLDNFINDGSFTHGVSWGPKHRTVAANYDSQGCSAYCADYTKFCYGIDNPRSGAAFYNINEIRAGDVIIVGNGSNGNGHWFIVLKRDGNRLYTAEGNCDKRVRIGWPYSISGNGFTNLGYGFSVGYHYNSDPKPVDTEPPTMYDFCVANINPDGYDVYIPVTDNVGVDRVEFPSWTESNGQDDLPSSWPRGRTLPDTEAYFFGVNRRDHNLEYGNYITHIYAWDGAGNHSVRCCPVVNMPEPLKDDGEPDIYYNTHIQNIGWRGPTMNGLLAGSVGCGVRAEAVQIKLKDNPYGGSVEYRAHIQGNGWLNWVKDNQTAGTEGQGKRLEALEIKLTGDIAKYYDVTYRAHIQGSGWQGWVKNGETAGSVNEGKRLEAYEIKLVKKSNPDIEPDPDPTPDPDPAPNPDPVPSKCTVKVSAEPSEGGNVSGNGSFDKGASVSVTASPNSGYKFAGWFNGSQKVSDDAQYSFYVSENTSLTANFEKTNSDNSDQTPAPSPSGTTTIYRLYNNVSGEHLYTISQDEVQALTGSSDWNYEGVGWNAPNSGTAVYRLYNPALADHLYTTDENEVKELTANSGWQLDFAGEPIFYSGGNKPIYRLYNAASGRHHLTTDEFEYSLLPQNGWTQEGPKLNCVS